MEDYHIMDKDEFKFMKRQRIMSKLSTILIALICVFGVATMILSLIVYGMKLGSISSYKSYVGAWACGSDNMTIQVIDEDGTLSHYSSAQRVSYEDIDKWSNKGGTYNVYDTGEDYILVRVPDYEDYGVYYGEYGHYDSGYFITDDGYSYKLVSEEEYANRDTNAQAMATKISDDTIAIDCTVYTKIELGFVKTIGGNKR